MHARPAVRPGISTIRVDDSPEHLVQVLAITQQRAPKDPFLEGAAEIILAHHERWDGKGYPKGLHEDEVPLGARIFMVCDTFDSMTSDRPYRKALSTQQALNEILKYSGSQFDPKVVEAFLDIYETWVRDREQMIAAGETLRAA